MRRHRPFAALPDLSWFLTLLLLGGNTPNRGNALSSSSSSAANTARGKLSAAWSSPSGKLTHSPELIIPEPRDPTALLLLTNAVQILSGRIRGCKSNVAFVQGSVMPALQTFCQEQAASLGGFPGPVPVVYCGTNSNVPKDGGGMMSEEELSEVAEAGADGLLVQVCEGKPLQSVTDLTDSQGWIETCQKALKAGLQPIPEITLAPEIAWAADDVDALVSRITEYMDGVEPVALVLTMHPPAVAIDDEAGENLPVPIPTVHRQLSKRIPILGSVRVLAGDNRLSEESQRFKEAGFAGTFLRSDCVPGFRLQPDLEIVAKFWEACVSDLKSTRSKSFGFRSKNNMEKNAMTQWSNYQNTIMESGALGDPEDSYSIVNEGAGEYKGFA